MKKILLILVCILLTSCTSNKKFYLNDEYYQEGTLEEIDSIKVEELENNSESFLVMIYTSGCFSCMDFEEVLNEFINDHSIKIYILNIDDIENTKMSKNIKYTPSLVIYKEGKVYKYLDANSDDDSIYYKDTKNLEKWLDKYILLAK